MTNSFFKALSFRLLLSVIGVSIMLSSLLRPVTAWGMSSSLFFGKKKMSTTHSGTRVTFPFQQHGSPQQESSLLLQQHPTSSSTSSTRLHVASSSSSPSSSDLPSSTTATTTSTTATITSDKSSILPFDWRRVVQSVWQSSNRPIVLFDGHCNLCNGAVCFCLDWDTARTFRFASLQSQVGQSLLVQTGRSPTDISSIVLVTSPTSSFRESDAVLRICQALRGSPVWPVLGFMGLACPRLLRDAVYKVVAKNRHRWMELTCRVDFDGEYHDRFVLDEDYVNK